MGGFIEFFQSVLYWHMHPGQYWADMIIVDLFFCFLAWFFWNFVYLVFRKRLHIRNLAGFDRVIGMAVSRKVWEIGPRGEECKYLIKFRRKGLYFLKDLIHKSRLYYNPIDDRKPFYKKLRDIYIKGENVVFREHPDSVIENYYYLGPANKVSGEYEEMADYIGMGKGYLALMAETCQTAIQSDPELTAERYQLDTVPLPIQISRIDTKDEMEKLTGKFNVQQS